MRSLRVESLSQENFKAFLTSSTLAIVHIGNMQRVTFLRGVERYFNAEYRKRIRFGYLYRDAGPTSRWLTKYIKMLFDAPMAYGYYLFRGGAFLDYHPGDYSLSSEDLGISGLTALAAIAFGVKGGVGSSIKTLDDRSSARVIDHFEKALARPVPQQRQRKPPPPGSDKRRAARTAQDPYATLGITPAATNEEVKAAYHRQSRLYHPDKVQHLGEKLKQVANAEAQSINAAYQEIKRQRGIR